MLTPLTPSYAHVVFYFHVGMATTSGADLGGTKLTIRERKGVKSGEPDDNLRREE
jgi:hypothetical protein